MIFKKKPTPKIIEDIQRLAYTVNSMSRLSRTTIRVQGKHPVTGGTSVVYYRNSISTVNELKVLLNSIFFNERRSCIEEFIKRVKDKVVDGYACGIDVQGFDSDGDVVDYELKFDNQSSFIDVLENGMFSIEDKKHSEFKLI